jgi:hypothetical protein
MAENYLVKVLIPSSGIEKNTPQGGTELSPDLFPVYRSLGDWLGVFEGYP